MHKLPQQQQNHTAGRIQSHLAECRRQVQTAPFWRDIICEALATFFLLSVQSSVALSWGKPEGKGSSLASATAMGCAVTILIEIFGPLGGAYMNPALTIAFIVAGKITVLKALIYILVQCGASAAGAGLLYWLTPPRFQDDLVAISMHPDLTVWQGLVTEIWVTSLLVFTIHASDNAARRPVFMNSIIIGFGVLVGSSAGGGYSGGSMNPACSFGPAVVMNAWQHHWIYWAGPITGGLLSTVLYYYVFDRIGHPSTTLPSKTNTHALQAQTPTSVTETMYEDNAGFIDTDQSTNNYTSYM